jgi:prevent-host-death family protein
MKTVGIFEARQKFSELVRRANTGERIGITRRGKLLALIVPPGSTMAVAEAFADIDEIRKRGKPLKGLTIKNLIEEGRR